MINKISPNPSLPKGKRKTRTGGSERVEEIILISKEGKRGTQN